MEEGQPIKRNGEGEGTSSATISSGAYDLGSSKGPDALGTSGLGVVEREGAAETQVDLCDFGDFGGEESPRRVDSSQAGGGSDDELNSDCDCDCDEGDADAPNGGVEVENNDDDNAIDHHLQNGIDVAGDGADGGVDGEGDIAGEASDFENDAGLEIAPAAALNDDAIENNNEDPLGFDQHHLQTLNYQKGPAPYFLTFSFYRLLSIVVPFAYVGRTLSNNNFQFYPTMSTIGASKTFTLASANIVAVTFVTLYNWVVRTFFVGDLTRTEIDSVSDKFKYALTECCLALNIFREEIGLPLSLSFGTLIFSKAVSYTASGRIKIIRAVEDGERGGGNSIGVAVLATLQAVACSFMVKECARDLFKNGPTCQILFLLEYSVLALSSVADIIRYFIYRYETSLGDTQWHRKNDIEFAVDFIQDSFRFTFYVCFFCIIFHFYGMPLNILRELWMSYTKLRDKVSIRIFFFFLRRAGSIFAGGLLGRQNHKIWVRQTHTKPL